MKTESDTSLIFSFQLSYSNFSRFFPSMSVYAFGERRWGHDGNKEVSNNLVQWGFS